jgi:hypothetical protein
MYFEPRNMSVCSQYLSQRLHALQPPANYDQRHALTDCREFFQSLSNSRAVINRLEGHSEILDPRNAEGIIDPAHRNDTGIKIKLFA